MTVTQVTLAEIFKIAPDYRYLETFFDSNEDCQTYIPDSALNKAEYLSCCKLSNTEILLFGPECIFYLFIYLSIYIDLFKRQTLEFIYMIWSIEVLLSTESKSFSLYKATWTSLSLQTCNCNTHHTKEILCYGRRAIEASAEKHGTPQ